MVGKNVKCEHSNVVINVAYSKLKLQLHFRITFLLLSQLTFRKINKWGEGGGGGGGIRAGGGCWKNLENLLSGGGGDAYSVLESTYVRNRAGKSESSNDILNCIIIQYYTLHGLIFPWINFRECRPRKSSRGLIFAICQA